MAKHKYIETPEELAKHFDSYKTECKSNPRKKHVFVGKDGTSDYELLERPLTFGRRRFRRTCLGFGSGGTFGRRRCRRKCPVQPFLA